MASESGDSERVTVSVPPDLEEWLDRQAADLGVDREQLLVQLLASYRAAEDADGDLATAEDLGDLLGPEDVEPLVKQILGDRLPDLVDAVSDRVASTVREDLSEGLREQLRDRIAEDVRESLREQLAADLRSELDGPDEGRLADLETEFEDLESEYRETLEDVRQRVVQVKRQTDAKAESDETEAELDRLETRIDGLEAEQDRLAELKDVLDRLDSVEAELERLEDVEHNTEHLDEVESDLADLESELTALRGRVEEVSAGRVERIESDLEDAREKLQTVAYVVRDLRDMVVDGSASEAALDGIKRRAAEEDVTRAACGNCGEGVQIGLLTDPSCPHCDATLGGLEPSGRPFGLGKATLTVAAGLEAGEQASAADELDDIPTATRGDRR